jgi:hypothetical protein
MEGTILNKNGKECVKAEASFALLSPKAANRLGISAEACPEGFE